jgi:hypothetical protein
MGTAARFTPGFLFLVVFAVCYASVGAAVAASEGTGAEPSRIRPGGCVVSVERVLQKYIEAVGGREAIEKLRTRSIEGTFTKDLHWDDPPYESYKMVILSDARGGTLVDEHKPGARRMEGYDGSVNWVKDEDGVELRRKFYLRKIAWACNPQSALRVEQYFPGLSINRAEPGRGPDFYVLEPEGLPSEHYALYFDKRTGLLRHIGYHWNVEDYREVDGVLVPHRLVAGRKGGSCTYQFEEIINNTPLTNAIFSPPER